MSFYHLCREAGCDVVDMVLKTTYDEYRTTTYDPAAKITLVNKLTTSEDEVFLPEEHQDLADGLQALQGRSQLDSFQGTLSLPPLNLDSITSLTSTMSLRNLDLDKIQRGWLYKILQDTIQAPQGKASHRATSTKDTRNLGRNVRTL
jgi:hypothetical protein